jgi:hypothetical protein
MNIQSLLQLFFEPIRLQQDRLQMSYEDQLSLSQREIHLQKYKVQKWKSQVAKLKHDFVDLESKISRQIQTKKSTKKRSLSPAISIRTEQIPQQASKITIDSTTTTSSNKHRKIEEISSIIPTINNGKTTTNTAVLHSTTINSKPTSLTLQPKASPAKSATTNTVNPINSNTAMMFSTHQQPQTIEINEEDIVPPTRPLISLAQQEPRTTVHTTTSNNNQKKLLTMQRKSVSMISLPTHNNNNDNNDSFFPRSYQQKHPMNQNDHNSAFIARPPPPLPPQPLSYNNNNMMEDENTPPTILPTAVPNSSNNNTTNRMNQPPTINNDNKNKPTLKYVEVVRNQAQRAALPGHTCNECAAFYRTMLEQGIIDPQHPQQNEAMFLQTCSRHKAKWVPPETPEGFWSLSLN